MKNEVTYTVTLKDGEFIVRFRLDGVRKPDWDYFTNDREDAEQTAKFTVTRYAENVKLAKRDLLS